MSIKHILFFVMATIVAACGEKNNSAEQTTTALDSTASVVNHIHKDALLDSVGTRSHVPTEITGKQAAEYAVKYLEEKGVNRVVVCMEHWIGAPLGGYLVDAKGLWKKDGKKYSTFRVGITDGSDEVDGKYSIGDEFAFIALGTDSTGKKIWLPEPGPDYYAIDSTIEFIGDYEFMFNDEDIKEFENLNSTFR
jgi:hypothetical protein